MLAIKKVLVATDFSDCSDAALMYARALAGQFGAQLHVLHNVEFRGAVDVAGIGVYTTFSPDLLTELENDARDRMNGLLSDSDRALLKAQVVVGSGETTAQAIVEYAASENIDLIVLGTHGRHGLSHLLLGSVAERVVREAPCPVLTVRPPQRDFVVAKPSVDAATKPSRVGPEP
jgi:nucleotide-binding universal stress UspA family protein